MKGTRPLDNHKARRAQNEALRFHFSGIENSKRGEYKNAIKDYNQAIRLNPKDAEVYFNRGMAKGNSSQYQDAIADFDTAIRLERNNAALATYYYKRSLAKDLLGRVEETKDDLQTALRLATQVQDENLIHLIKTNLRNLSRQS